MGIQASKGNLQGGWDYVKAFGVGAAAGAIGAATGGAVLGVASGAGIGAGLSGTVAAGAGAVGGAASSATLTYGNAILLGDYDPNKTLGKQVAENAMWGAASGLVIGGVGNGVVALRNGRTFWTGDYVDESLTMMPVRGVQQIGAYEKGQEGLRANNITQNNTRIASPSGTVRYRIPDEMITDDYGVITRIGEVKHYSIGRTVNYTKQLQDFVNYANQNQVQFHLYVPNGVNISSPLQNAINQSNFAWLIRY